MTGGRSGARGSNDEQRAASVAEWKQIAQHRLAALDGEIARLENARSYLQGALLCRYDHPLTECAHMGREIDRRLLAT